MERWTWRKKVALVEAVEQGITTPAELQRLYSISIEEFESWKRLLGQGGERALKTTKLQIYRTSVRTRRKPAHRPPKPLKERGPKPAEPVVRMVVPVLKPRQQKTAPRDAAD